jgi:YD repeat-containing protein
VSTVTTDVGLTVSYSYDVQGRLNLVTKPDNTTVSFVYDGQNRITAVKDSDGKILESHTYDVLGRGLTSSRANAVDSVTVTYP